MFAPCGHIVHLYLTPCTAEVGGSRWVQLEFKMFAVPLFARNCLCAIGTDSLCPVDSLETNVGEWEEKLLWRTFLICMLNTVCECFFGFSKSALELPSARCVRSGVICNYANYSPPYCKVWGFILTWTFCCILHISVHLGKAKSEAPFKHKMYAGKNEYFHHHWVVTFAGSASESESSESDSVSQLSNFFPPSPSSSPPSLPPVHPADYKSRLTGRPCSTLPVTLTSPARH